MNPRFSDVSFEPDAQERADQLSDERAGFSNLGFRQLGFLGDNPIPGEEIWVHEILTAPNEEAFLTLALSPSDPLSFRPRTIPSLILHTALADGSLIITTTCPEYLQFLNRPRAGSFLEGRTEAAPGKLWELHRRRVDAIARERNSPAVQHDSMRLRIQIAERCWEISAITAGLVVLSVAAVLVGSGVSLFGMMHRLGVQFQGWIGIPLTLLGSMILGIAAMWTVRSHVARAWFGGEWLARQLPWPRNKPFNPSPEGSDAR